MSDQPVSACCVRSDDVKQAFARHNIRCTRQRSDVYETLSACRCHPTAEQLHKLVSERAPGTSLATVYNTLDALVDAGMCRRVHTSAGARYDADLSDHIHVVTPDGKLIDVHAEDIDPELTDLPARLRHAVAKRLGLPASCVCVHVHTECDSL